MRIVRWAATLASALALAACESHFLDPDLAGVWGGQNLEVLVEADQVTATLVCKTRIEFEGDVRLGENQDFQRTGILTTPAGSQKMRLSGYLAHPDTMKVYLYNPDDPLSDPAQITLVHGQPGEFNEALILCAA